MRTFCKRARRMGRKKVIGGQGFQLACTLAPRLCAIIGAGTRGQFPPVGCVRFPGDGRRKEEAWAGTYARQGKPPPSCATRFAAPHSLHNLHYLCTIHLDRHIMQGVFSTVHARLAQLDRALASGAKGRKFDSCIARHKNQGLMINSWVLFFAPKIFFPLCIFIPRGGEIPRYVCGARAAFFPSSVASPFCWFGARRVRPECCVAGTPAQNRWWLESTIVLTVRYIIGIDDIGMHALLWAARQFLLVLNQAGSGNFLFPESAQSGRSVFSAQGTMFCASPSLSYTTL